jgi:hypothetical protein
MRAQVAQYLNEIVSLSIMGLMCVALVAGQAGAAPQVPDQAIVEPIEAEYFEGVEDWSRGSFLEERLRLIDKQELEIDITFRFRQTGE